MKDYIIVDEITDEPFTAEQWRKIAESPLRLPEGARVVGGSFKLKIVGDKVEIVEFKIHTGANRDPQDW